MGDISSAITLALLEGAAHSGIPREQLIAAAGIDAAILDADTRLSYDVHRAVWEAAERATGDPDLGLHIAEAVPTHRFGLVARTCLTSPDVGAAFANLVRYSRLLRSDINYTLDDEGESVRFGITMTVPPWVIPRHVAEWIMTIVWLGITRGSQAQSSLRAVRFQHAEPPDTTEHRRVFGGPVEFGQRGNELVLDRGALDLPVQESDPETLAHLEERAIEVLAKLPPVDPFISDLHRVLYDSLASGEVAISSVCRSLGLDRSELARELRQRGTSYRSVLRSMRTDLARAYLEDREWSISDVAFVLGYSDAAAFKRAFRSWTGKTPARYRQEVFQEIV
ncbi:MAG: AraC family transcriptional regulator [Deltaproteobacteria bacterium]|nr:AraC family transcriptional regulator [Deltaproteobacteria bacterium]